MGRILLFYHLLHPTLQDKQRSGRSARTLYGFREEIAQFEDALGSMSVLAGHGAADRGGMNADLLGYLLDHHWSEAVDAQFQKLSLAADDGLADLEDGVFPLFDVLDELNSGRVAVANVVADVLIGFLRPVQH